MTTSPAELAAAVLAEGEARGLVAVGICSAEPFSSVATDMKRRLASGTAGRLTFTYRDPDTATDVKRSFPWAERLVVGAASYLPAAGSPTGEAGTGRIARFGTEDFYPLVREPLAAIAQLLRGLGYRAAVLTDDNRLVDRAAAVRAGVGWWGKNSMVLAPRFGPWLLLGSVVTDARMPATPAMRRDCGTCDACLSACPTGALVAPGILDATLCIAYWAQTAGVIPPEIRIHMEDRLYGCDDCLEACPPGSRMLAVAPTGRGTVDLVTLLRSSDDELLEAFGHFYIPKRQPRYLRRNALVALGNVGTRDHLPLLGEYLASDDWLLRGHAAWAVGRISGSLGGAMLTDRLPLETDERVRSEITTALGAAG
ncbi:MAG: tRNA epoxyqueuosine(34) reductase QueG [Acidimicrobiia bacterium]